MKLFFELLQLALGNRDRLDIAPTAKEWAEIYRMSERQAVSGILLCGLERLPAEQRPSQALLLQWIGVGQMIERRNVYMDKCCVDLLNMILKSGETGTILKGQGIAKLYNKDLCHLRQSGDIDVYVGCGMDRAKEMAYAMGQNNIEWDYHHLHLNIWDDVEIELHYRVEVLFNLFKNRKLQKWFKDNESSLFSQVDGLTVPTVEIDLVYVLLHIYRHYLTEGVGLRQLMDYYFALKKADGKFGEYSDGKTVEETLKSFGVYHFAQGVMWVLQEVFGLDKSLMYCNPERGIGSFILSEIMIGGNFGHYDGRLNHRKGKLSTLFNVIKHNLRIIRYNPVDSIWASLWLVWHKLWKISRSISF